MTRLIGELQGESDTKYKDFNSGLIKSKKDLIGVRMPKLRKMASKIIEDDWRSFISEETIVLEEDIIAALVIANAEMPPEERLELTKRFIPSIDNWAVCDILCGDWKASAEIKDELWAYCGELLASGEEFKMRVGAVMMLSKFLDEEHIDGVLARFTLYKTTDIITRWARRGHYRTATSNIRTGPKLCSEPASSAEMFRTLL